MAELDAWYRVATPRKEVREGRSFNPDEFAIHLEQVISRRGAEDYRQPDKFFARNVFTRALRDHAGMVLRRLAGKTENTAPVLTLVTQFGGGKTHTLTALYHLANSGKSAAVFPGVQELLDHAGLSECPGARVAAFVGNAWDPQPGHETPWLDIAVQLAGTQGAQALGPAAKTTAPGTDALAKLFEAAGGRVLILCDEVLNFCNRHRGMVDGFYAFVQNLTVAMTGTTHGAAIISLPRSQVEMTDWDQEWQTRITKVVRRVAKDLIANDEAEISEVVRRRLFEDLGPEKKRRTVAKLYADWCYERRAQLPPEWTAVDTASTESKAREFLQQRFEACYPFHPTTLSVFQRKWQALPQYQQTRGTLAMLAQWISWAYRVHHQQHFPEPLLTLGSAPMHERDFRSAVLGQLGEPRLETAIDVDVAGEMSHARALDADLKGPLRDLHRRVATAIFFESSGGQSQKIAHLPELRFALTNPQLDTTTIDSAASALESRAFFLRKISSDGFQIHFQPTLKKVVNDRKASLDREKEVLPLMRKVVRAEFENKASLRVDAFPKDSADVEDTPRLRLTLVDPELEWAGAGPVRQQLAAWTRNRGQGARNYPAALVWCLKKPGGELHERAEDLLAWRKVEDEIRRGVLGPEVQTTDLQSVASKLKDAAASLTEEVWASYRFVVIADTQEPEGLRTIDLGAGHASSGETLAERVIAALKSDNRLSLSFGAGYIDRNWPVALRESGAWPVAGLRKCFLDGSLSRLLDPDTVLRTKIVEFVTAGEFGLASGAKPDGTYERLWFAEPLRPDEVAFEYDVYLLRKERVKALRQPVTPAQPQPSPPEIAPEPPFVLTPTPPPLAPVPVTLRISGSLPPESWNRFGRSVIPKLNAGRDLEVRIDLSCPLDTASAPAAENEIRQILEDLGLSGVVKVVKES